MISQETANAFFSQFDKKSNPNALVESIANFVKEEPHVAAFMLIALSSEALQNSVTAGLTAISMYRKMQENQLASDQLKRDLR